MILDHALITSVAAFSAVCIAAVVFFERKNPASSLAWVLVLFFLPVVGIVFYLFLGSGYKVNKRKRYAFKAARDELYDKYIKKHLRMNRTAAFLDRHAESTRLLTYLKSEGDGVFSDDNAAETFTDGNDMFSRLVDDLMAAKSHIHLLFYIFRADALGRRIVSTLADRARQGVKVRLIYDSVGSLLSFDPMFNELKNAGGEVRAFSPIFSTLSSHLRLNYRNHRKIVVIDGRIGYVGGMNVGLEYMGRDSRLRPWRDTHLRITGTAVWSLQERFLMDWSYCVDTAPEEVEATRLFPEPAVAGDLGMQIISSGPDTYESPIKSGLLSMLYSAEKTAFIQTPYFTPDDSFADAMRIAAHSNVDVRLMIPKIGDYRIAHMATLGYARDVCRSGIKVYLYNGFIHSKTMVVDGRVASIGTANITNRSFTLDFEVNAFVYSDDFGRRQEEIFLRDQENSEPAPPEYFDGQPALARAEYNLWRLLAPMM